MATEATLRCSFCNKAEDEVHKLIQAPAACICDECISASTCVRISSLKKRLPRDGLSSRPGAHGVRSGVAPQSGSLCGESLGGPRRGACPFLYFCSDRDHRESLK